MNFLTKKYIYHGDLATRNILLTDTLDAKISDFGLSKRLYSDLQTAQSLKNKDDDKLPPLPVKWLAIEVLQFQEYVPIKSDVWSFGVLTWEIFTCGKEPYLGNYLNLQSYVDIVLTLYKYKQNNSQPNCNEI